MTEEAFDRTTAGANKASAVAPGDSEAAVTPIPVALSADELLVLDAWIAHEAQPISRSEAIHKLLARALREHPMGSSASI